MQAKMDSGSATQAKTQLTTCNGRFYPTSSKFVVCEKKIFKIHYSSVFTR